MAASFGNSRFRIWKSHTYYDQI